MPADNAASISWMKVPIIGMPGCECGRRLLDGAETEIAEDFKAEFGPCEKPGRWMAGMLFLCDDHAAIVAREFGDDFEEIKDAICDLYGWDRSRV